MNPFDLAVVCHLRWSFVWQRPQQLLSRLARNHRILLVEEPVLVPDGRQPVARLEECHPGVVLLAPQLTAEQCAGVPLWLWPAQEAVAEQVKQALRALDFRSRALWLYTPTPEFLVDVVQPSIIVYDVMDELAGFKFAPPELKERERRLLGRSDVVFTGGASLYDAKKRFNSNTHLFASGVDEAHYSQACQPETEPPEWMAALPSPRATYVGVIDERLDYDLIRSAAEARPDVQFVMCGPVVKVDPDSLPQAANVHYAGQQPYEELPRILSGTDVCLMPFAMNEATRYISPTKTLEYMATHRPIVSTPVRDVERFYSDIVYLADTPASFVAALDSALNEPAQDRARKRAREEKILAEQAWDAIADNMETLMQRAWARKSSPVVQRPVSARGLDRRSLTSGATASPVTGGD